MNKRITVILGHPDSSSFCAALSDHYVAAAEKHGHSVRYFKLGDMTFDPILRRGYKQRQALEPDLVALQEAITWAQHLVFVYPVWWGGMPAIMKGMFDRLFLPGFAFKYRENSPFWDKLLQGRTAHAIATMDTPPWYFSWVYSRPAHHQMRKTILEFCGIKPVKITSMGPVRYATERQRQRWMENMARFAHRA